MTQPLRISCIFLFVASLTGLNGCGSSDVVRSDVTPDRGNQNSASGENGASTATDSSEPESTVTESTAPQEITQETGSNEQSGKQPEIADGSDFNQGAEGESDSDTINQTEQSKVQKSASSPPPPPTPSEQQIANWKLEYFEPLKLKASVEYEEMGFTQRIVPLPSSRQFLLGGSTITLWTAGSEKPDFVFADWRQNENLSLSDLSIAPSGKWFAATNSSGELILFDLDQRRELVSKKIGQSVIPSISISTDSQKIATASFGGEISIWNATGLVEQNKFEIDSRGIKSIRFISPDRLLVAAESISAWDVKTGKKIKDLEGDRYYESLSLSPNSQYLTYGTEKGLKVCKASDFESVALLPCNVGLDELIVWKDDRSLASISANLVRIWDVPSTRMVQAIDNRGSDLAGACWLEKRVLAIASLLRKTRFWTTDKDAMELNWPPIQAEISLPEEPAQEPSSGFQFASVIDLRSFPRLPDAIPQLEMDYMVQYTTASSMAEASLFCRYVLHQAGWKETEAASPTAGYMSFRKYGFQLDCSVTELPNQGTTVSMTSLGNFGLEMVPELPELAETTYKSSRTSMYSSKSDILTLEVALLKAMTERGWIAYSRLASSHSEKPDQRDFSFLKNSAELRVTIGKHYSDPNAINIQYTAFPVLNSIPIPKGCSYIEFNGVPELQLVANSRQTIEELVEFFNVAMRADGWMVVERQKPADSDVNWLLYTRDQHDVTIGLRSAEDGWTLITVGSVGSSGSFQLPQPANASDASQPQLGIEAADFPLVDAVQDVQYQKLEKTLTFNIPKVTLEKFMKMYEQKLSSMGWTKSDRAMLEKEFCYSDFSKDNVTITLRGNLRDDMATCSVQGDGLLWDKKLPGPREIVSFETWLRNNQKIASLEFLGQYESEMRALQAATPSK